MRELNYVDKDGGKGTLVTEQVLIKPHDGSVWLRSPFRYTPASPEAVKAAEEAWPGFAAALRACRAVKG